MELRELLRMAWQDGNRGGSSEGTDEAFEEFLQDVAHRFTEFPGQMNDPDAADIILGVPIAPNVAAIPIQPHAEGHLTSRGLLTRPVTVVVWGDGS